MARFDLADGGKEVLPISWCTLVPKTAVSGYTAPKNRQTADWRWKAPPAPRPLYNLDQLAARPDASVLIVEGEKTADAAGELFPEHVVTTWQGGSQATGKADWSTLAGRDVTIWPDADDPGVKASEAVARLATKAGAASVAIVQVPADFPKGWDLADAVPEGADLDAMLAAAEPWTPPPEPEVPPGTETQGEFRVSSRGVEMAVEKRGDDGSTTIEWQWVASEIRVAALTRNAAGEAWGRLLEVRDRDDTWHQWAMPMGLLAGDGVAYREHLLHLGAELAPGGWARNELHRYLCIWRPAERARCVERVGWHGRAFVLPEATIGATNGERVLLQTTGTAPQFDMAGSMKGWQAEVAVPAVGNSRMVLALSTAFAAALLHPAAEESGGVHFHGQSSTGKTTIAGCAASTWGVPKRTWRTTANAAEAMARGSCDAMLYLDEIGQAEPWEIDALAYLIGNETGKARMRRDATARETLTWRTLFLSTGEVGLLAKLVEIGRRPRAGQAMRLVEVPSDAGAGLGCFETLHGRANGDALARHLKVAADQHKGHAARAFVEKVAADFEGVGTTVAASRERWQRDVVPADADGQVLRAAGRFALIAAAGELAQSWGIVPWPEGEPTRAAATCFEAWLANRGGSEPQEVVEGLAQVRKFLEQHGNDGFERAWDVRRDRDGQEIPDRVVNRAGFRRLVDAGDSEPRWEYFVLPASWQREVCKGSDHKMIARAMVAKGWMQPGDGNHFARRCAIPREGRPRCYHVLPDFMES